MFSDILRGEEGDQQKGVKEGEWEIELNVQYM